MGGLCKLLIGSQWSMAAKRFMVRFGAESMHFYSSVVKLHVVCLTALFTTVTTCLLASRLKRTKPDSFCCCKKIDRIKRLWRRCPTDCWPLGLWPPSPPWSRHLCGYISTARLMVIARCVACSNDTSLRVVNTLISRSEMSRYVWAYTYDGLFVQSSSGQVVFPFFFFVLFRFV